MSQNKETQFSINFNKQLLRAEPTLFIAKLSSFYRAGIPDYYMDLPTGHSGWFEYKWTDKVWTTHKDVICSTKSWILQRQWLEERHARSIKTGVIIGAPRNKAIFLKYPYIFDPSQHSFDLRSNVAKYLVSYLQSEEF